MAQPNYKVKGYPASVAKVAGNPDLAAQTEPLALHDLWLTSDMGAIWLPADGSTWKQYHYAIAGYVVSGYSAATIQSLIADIDANIVFEARETADSAEKYQSLYKAVLTVQTAGEKAAAVVATAVDAGQKLIAAVGDTAQYTPLILLGFLLYWLNEQSTEES